MKGLDSRSLAGLALGAGPVLLVACAAEDTGIAAPDAAADGLTYYAEVKPIIDARCAGCHAEGEVAPFSLSTYDEVYAQRDRIPHYVQNRIMPPWLAGRGCDDYKHDISLSDEQIETLVSWAQGEAAAGDPEAFVPLDDDPLPSLDRVDATLSMPVEYVPRQEPDDYRCFVLEWDAEATEYVTGFRAVPGNREIVHHIIAFSFGPDVADSIRARDEAEEGPGYTCFGAATDNDQDMLSMSTIGAWAPGGGDNVFPAGTGVRLEPGSVVALQVHYNTLDHESAEPDVTEVELQLEPSVDKEADILWFTNPSWTGSDEMHIPAGESSVTHEFVADPSGLMGLITGGTIPSDTPFLIHSAAMHMHELGVRGRQALVRQGGDEDCLLDVPRWDFHWQRTYGFEEPKRFEPGDQLRLECNWDNSADNQQREPEDVYWGDGTQDEMCLGIFYVSEVGDE